MVEEIESHILKRYELLNKQGKGAYGVVYKAIDKKTHEISSTQFPTQKN